MSIQDRLYTTDEFEVFLTESDHDTRLFELINGEIIEKMPSEEHGLIASIISGEIYLYLKQHPGGRVTVETRFQAPDDDLNSRIPDVAYTSPERLLPVMRAGAVPQMPDLAVEIKSPRDTLVSLREKANYYLNHGVRLVWLVFPELQQIEIHTAETVIGVVGIEDTLDGGDVLPGFALPVNDIFQRD